MFSLKIKSLKPSVAYKQLTFLAGAVVFIAIFQKAALSIIIGALQSGALPILLAIIAAPFVFLLYVVIARVYCEVIIVLFKIADNTAILAGRHEQPPAPPAV